MVFIHGWTCDATFWKARRTVYEKRRSLPTDLPGHGLSDKPEIPYTMELFARVVDAAKVGAKVRKATLVGHSLGTPVAVQFLRRHPARVAGLVAVDGSVPQPPRRGRAPAAGSAGGWPLCRLLPKATRRSPWLQS